MKPLDQVDQPPANDAMNRRDRTALDRLDECPPLSVIEPRPLSRCLAVEQAIGAARVEPNHPVTHNLQTHPTDPRR